MIEPFAMMEQILTFWPHVAAVLNVVLTLVASGHAVPYFLPDASLIAALNILPSPPRAV